MRVIDVAEFVEAVADFVGDAGTGGAVVGGGVPLAVEIRRLQDAGGEKFGVGAEYNDGADGLRIDAPLGGISRLSQLRQVSQTIEGFGAAHVAEGVAAQNLQRGIVDPGVRVADADGQRGKLGQRLFLGRPLTSR